MSNLSCNEVVRRLPALVAGDLDREAVLEIEVHTEFCWECRSDLQESRGLASTLESIWQRHLNGSREQCVPFSAAHLAANGHESIATNDNGHGALSMTSRIHSALDRIACYAPVKTVLGTLHLVATDDGLARVFFPGAQELDVEDWCCRNDLVPLLDEDEIEPYAGQLQCYLAGDRTEFDLPVDFRTVTPFMRDVLDALRGIPYGVVRNYREIATQIGNPNAQRAVGNAVKRNPVPIVVPCHRVIKTDGTIGGYAGGPLIKERLLRLEGALLAS
ncbi:MAG: methylated-DNA--[protein]-cysteine S-methyltransferase [Thermomicrobiaceae bacterium]